MAERALPMDVAQLVADYSPVLFRYAYRLSGSAQDAEDLTQQVFLIAQQKLGQVRDSQNVRAWLFTVLRNCYLKSHRPKVPRPLGDNEFDLDAVPAKVCEQGIDSEQLQRAIGTLGEEFKLVVLLFYFEHRSYREISELLDVPPGTVMSRLARAKAHLRRELAGSAPAEAASTDQTSIDWPATDAIRLARNEVSSSTKALKKPAAIGP